MAISSLTKPIGATGNIRKEEERPGLFSQAIDAGLRGLDPRSDAFKQALNFMQNSRLAETQRNINAANAFSGISGTKVRGTADPLLGANLQAFQAAEKIKSSKADQLAKLDEIIGNLERKLKR